jgi:hypothetical protein
MGPLKVTIYTDPGCPFGFNAQRQELQLVWHYGLGLEVVRRMIVLREASVSFQERGLSREMIAANFKRLRSCANDGRACDPEHDQPSQTPDRAVDRARRARRLGRGRPPGRGVPTQATRRMNRQQAISRGSELMR